jgi:hypothetical protein
MSGPRSWRLAPPRSSQAAACRQERPSRKPIHQRGCGALSRRSVLHRQVGYELACHAQSLDSIRTRRIPDRGRSSSRVRGRVSAPLLSSVAAVGDGAAESGDRSAARDGECPADRAGDPFERAGSATISSCSGTSIGLPYDGCRSTRGVSPEFPGFVNSSNRATSFSVIVDPSLKKSVARTGTARLNAPKFGRVSTTFGRGSRFGCASSSSGPTQCP